MSAKENEQMRIMSFMRLLTPLQVAKMTKVSTGVKKVSLTDVMLGKEVLFNANADKLQDNVFDEDSIEVSNVIPFPSGQEKSEESNFNHPEESNKIEGKDLQKEDQPQPFMSKENLNPNIDIEIDKENLDLSKEEAALSAIGIESQQELDAKQKALEEEENKKKVSTSVFIMREKDKSRESQEKLKEIEIKKTYEQNIGVNIEVDKGKSAQDRDLKKDANQGVIIDKKQF